MGINFKKKKNLKLERHHLTELTSSSLLAYHATSHAIYAKDALWSTHMNKNDDGQQCFFYRIAGSKNGDTVCHQRDVIPNQRLRHRGTQSGAKRYPVRFGG